QFPAFSIRWAKSSSSTSRGASRARVAPPNSRTILMWPSLMEPLAWIAFSLIAFSVPDIHLDVDSFADLVGGVTDEVDDSLDHDGDDVDGVAVGVEGQSGEAFHDCP